MATGVRLRAVLPEDLPILFENQRDPEAAAMAAFPARSRPEFDAHRARTAADPSNSIWAIVVDGQLAGDICCFGEPGERHVGYWLGREFWGRGIATAALELMLEQIRERPLFASVAEHNTGSLRVLEKCGFERLGASLAEDGVTEVLLRLSA